MSAGCRYTNNTTKELACWIDIPTGDTDEDNSDESQFRFDALIEDLTFMAESLGYSPVSDHWNNRKFENGLFVLELESTYYGDGVVIQINPRMPEYEKEYNLAISNLERAENRILRSLLKNGYKLRIANSGYSSHEVTKV